MNSTETVRLATPESRIERIVAGDRLAVTRGITLVENERGGYEQLLAGLYSSTGRAYRIGITGPPGAGKSTITYRLIQHYLAHNLTIAVIAIDPTSPFTGGAILGDRIRMQSEGMRDGVFIRSMATRGSVGGLNTKAQDVADILDAAGFDIILYETVGVGQSELDIVNAADTTVVALVPESGDSIQAMKSGLMEIADLFVMNKSDRDGANQAIAALKTILMFRVTHAEGEWIPPVVSTVATNGDGIEELALTIGRHRAMLESSGELVRRRLARERLRTEQLTERLLQRNFWSTQRIARLQELLPELAERRLSPLALAQILTVGE